MQVHGYNKEKDGNDNLSFYLKGLLIGAFLAGLLIGGIKLLSYIIKLVIKNCIWVIGILGVAFLIKHFFFRNRNEGIQEMRIVD